MGLPSIITQPLCLPDGSTAEAIAEALAGDEAEQHQAADAQGRKLWKNIEAY